MAQLVIRLESGPVALLQRRARQNGRSLQVEVREILRNAVSEGAHSGGLGTEISSLFAKVDLDFDIPELRGTPRSRLFYK